MNYISWKSLKKVEETSSVPFQFLTERHCISVTVQGKREGSTSILSNAKEKRGLSMGWRQNKTVEGKTIGGRGRVERSMSMVGHLA